jgi:putative DNA primase/helicase
MKNNRENQQYKNLGDGKEDDNRRKNDCSITKTELLAICKDKTPYFNEEPPLFTENVVPVDWQCGNKECGAELYGDNNKPGIVIDKAVEYLREKRRYKTPADTGTLHVYHNGIYEKNGEQYVRWFIEQKYGTVAILRTANEIIYHLKSKSQVERENINSGYKCIPVHNGILNLETLELEAFSPDRLWTFKLPVWYDPKAECPKFKKFLGEVFAGAEETIISIQEQFGYCLYPEMPAEVSFWWYGAGANGKTQMANILVALLGPKNVAHIDLRTLENGRFDRGHLFGKLANIIGEPDPRRLEKSTVFKRATGGDPIYSDVKNRHSIEFVNFAKFFIYANVYPKIDDISVAFWRRVLAVNFPNKFDGSNAVKDIAKEIATPEELSGILNWALEGLRRLKANDWEFTITKEMKEEKERLILFSNPVRAFVDSCCVSDRTAKTATIDLFEAFIIFCDDMGLPDLSEDEFGKALGRMPRVISAYTMRNGRQVRAKRGIRLKEEGE